MKYSFKGITICFTLFFVFSLLLVGCKSDAAADKADAANNAAAADAADKPVHIKSERAAIAIGFWHYAIVGGPQAEKDRYAGRWIQINRDDTFVSGLYDQQTNSGTWTFDDPSTTIMLRYAKSDENLAYEWKVQGFGETVIWLGNTPSNPKATQIKMNKHEPGDYPKAK